MEAFFENLAGNFYDGVTRPFSRANSNATGAESRTVKEPILYREALTTHPIKLPSSLAGSPRTGELTKFYMLQPLFGDGGREIRSLPDCNLGSIATPNKSRSSASVSV